MGFRESHREPFAYRLGSRASPQTPVELALSHGVPILCEAAQGRRRDGLRVFQY